MGIGWGEDGEKDGGGWGNDREHAVSVLDMALQQGYIDLGAVTVKIKPSSNELIYLNYEESLHRLGSFPLGYNNFRKGLTAIQELMG